MKCFEKHFVISQEFSLHHTTFFQWNNLFFFFALFNELSLSCVLHVKITSTLFRHQQQCERKKEEKDCEINPRSFSISSLSSCAWFTQSSCNYKRFRGFINSRENSSFDSCIVAKFLWKSYRVSQFMTETPFNVFQRTT